MYLVFKYYGGFDKFMSVEMCVDLFDIVVIVGLVIFM